MAPTGAATPPAGRVRQGAWPRWLNSVCTMLFELDRSRCSDRRSPAPGRTPRRPRRRFRRCAATSPTTARSPKRSRAYIAATSPTSVLSLRSRHAELDLPTYPFEHRRYWFTHHEKAKPASRPDNLTRGHRPGRPMPFNLEDGRIESWPACSTARAAIPPPMPGAGPTQPLCTQAIAGYPLHEIRWEKTAAPSPRRRGPPGGSSSATTPLSPVWLVDVHRGRLSSAHCQTAGLRRRRGTPDRGTRAAAMQDGARCGSASRGTWIPRHRRCARCCGCNTASWAARSACSAPPPPPTSAKPSGWLPMVRNGLPIPTRCHPSKAACGVLPRGRTGVPQVWGGSWTSPVTPTGLRWSGRSPTVAGRGSDRPAGQRGARSAAGPAHRSAPPEQLQLRSEATYLVTGGLGAIRTRDRRISHRARRARGGPGQSPRARRCHPGRIGSLGGGMTAASGCSPPMSPTRMMSPACWRKCRAHCHHWPGIIHAAGENSTTPLSSLDNSELDRVFAGRSGALGISLEAIADPELGFFAVHLVDLPRCGAASDRAPTAQPTPSWDGLTWNLPACARHPAVSINFGPWSAGMWPMPTPRPTGTARRAHAVPARRRPGRYGRCHGRRRLPQRHRPWKVVARIDWARFLPIICGPAAGRCSTRSPARFPIPGSAPGPRPDRSGRRLGSAPVQQRRKNRPRLPPCHRRRGDPRRRGRDPRGGRVLRPRHGFADGDRSSGANSSGRWPTNSRDAGDGLPAALPTWPTSCSATS